MKKITVLLMLLCITFGAKAQLLWKISGNQLEKPSYVLGSHHLAPLSILDSIAGFSQAFSEVQQVYGEIQMNEMTSPESMQKMQQIIILPGDTTLQTLFTQAQYDTLAVKIKTLMGADLQMLNKVKPSFISTQLSVVLALKTIKNFNPNEQMDTWIQQEASKQGKSLGGLETVDFQMGVLFNTQTLQRQAEQLYGTVTHLEDAEKMSVDMNEAYMKQNLDNILKVFNRKFNNECDALPEEEDALIYNRNADWAKKLPAILKEKATLVVVGCGHLPGNRGLLHLLRAQGYTVEPVK